VAPQWKRSIALIGVFFFFFFNTVMTNHANPLQGRAIPGLFKWNVLVTTYEMILADSALLKTLDWRYTVIDEAHRLKNKVPFHSQRPCIQVVADLSCQYFATLVASTEQQAADRAADLQLLGHSTVDGHAAPKQHRGAVVAPQLPRSRKVPVRPRNYIFPPAHML
jgi:hypothetical protein